jgi:hypothetical protein
MMARYGRDQAHIYGGDPVLAENLRRQFGSTPKQLEEEQAAGRAALANHQTRKLAPLNDRTAPKNPIERALEIKELEAEPNSNNRAKLKRRLERHVGQQHRAGELTADEAVTANDEIERIARARGFSSDTPTGPDIDLRRAIDPFRSALDLVRRALEGFEEVARLPDDIREQLFADLAEDVCLARRRINAGRRRLFMRDVRVSFERAGLSVPRWEHHWERHKPGSGESLYFDVAHKLGAAVDALLRADFPLDLRKKNFLPKDLSPLARLVAKIDREMSPRMKAWQDAELRRRRVLWFWEV